MILLMTNYKLPLISAAAGRGKYRVTAEAKIIGIDIIVSIWGGTMPHIGSVAVAVPRPSLKTPGAMSATSSVVNYLGHKDETVSRYFSEKIAARLNSNCVAAAGIHIDRASSADIDKIKKNCGIVCAKIIKSLEKRSE
jgi:gallate decarboxylase subunit D